MTAVVSSSPTDTNLWETTLAGFSPEPGPSGPGLFSRGAASALFAPDGLQQLPVLWAQRRLFQQIRPVRQRLAQLLLPPPPANLPGDRRSAAPPARFTPPNSAGRV